MKHLSNKISFVFCLLLVASFAFAASEAEYKKLSKSWTLNADGSQEFRYNMELTLFTHTAMNSTYGESFIVYNPAYQTLKINESYTKQKNGNVVRTPDNAFVEVLPAAAANAPAYNGLKEMVVVHTGLELGATIYLDYTITTKPGYLPALDIYQGIEQTSPVKECKLTISVPDSKTLNYHLSNLSAKPAISADGGQKVYSWTLRNIPAMSRWADHYYLDSPLLAANTYASPKEMAETLTKQMDVAKSLPLLKTLAETITQGATSDLARLKAVYAYIQNSYAHTALGLSATGYKLRPIEDVINSAYGTDGELVNVFQGLLKALGIKSEVCAILPATDATGMGLHNALLYVKAEADGQTFLLSASADRTKLASDARQYYPALNLATGEILAAAPQSAAISAKAEIALGEKPEASIDAKISNFYLDIEGNTAKAITAGDKDAKTNASADATALSYKQTLATEKVGDYTLVSLPDFPFSAAHSNWAAGTGRDILLTLPVAYDESYEYHIALGGKTLCTPATNVKRSNAIGSVEISIRPEADGATVKRTLKFAKTQIQPKEYAAYLDLMRTWGDKNYMQVLVK